MVTKTEIAEALNYLLEMDRPGAAITQIRNAVRDWQTKPIMFAGHLEPLNALLNLGLYDAAAMDRVLAIAEDRLKDQPGERRKDYQRELMRARRQRQYLAIRLKELESGREISGEERKQYMVEVQRRWMSERNKMLKEHPTADWDERNVLIEKFWTDIERRLEANIQSIERGMMRKSA